VRPRLAGGIALAAGLAAAIPTAPKVSWWMPPLAFALATIVVWRILRPSPRRIDVLDEI
jgi:membrane protein implicated in regulation of membrane protease activity